MIAPKKTHHGFNSQGEPLIPLFTFDPVTHTGRMGNEVWPSVTQLLNEFKLIDYTGVPEATLERKRILGTRVHAATALLDDCSLDEEHFNALFPECIPYLEAYRKFRIIEKFDAEPKVGRLVSLKWKFHGEPDEHGVHIGTRGGKRCVIDYKTCFKHFESVGPQTAAYAMLLKECLRIDTHERYSLLLKPNGSYDLIQLKDPVDRTDFLYCLHLSWQKRTKYKTTKEIEYAST